MHVTSYQRLMRPPQRGQVAAVLLLWLASIAGTAQAVEFDEKLSDPENWTKLRYRIRWKGGYQTGPGQ